MAANLRKGDKGEEVRQLQVFIQYNPQDGVFDDALDARVRSLQKLAGVKVDGVVGPKTREALKAYMQKYRKFVSEIQSYMGFVPTGIYDKLTRDQVRFSQQMVGVPVNENISVKEWKTLLAMLKKKAENDLKPVFGPASMIPKTESDLEDDIQIGDNPKEDFEDEADRKEHGDTLKMDDKAQKAIKVVAGVLVGLAVIGGIVWLAKRQGKETAHAALA